jgi:AcrR family transcriptional regulator
MDRSKRKILAKQNRREHIVDSAERVFRQKGYDGTTLPAVAEAAGYNRRTLYFYFRNKEELYLAVALRGLNALHAAIQSAAATDGSLRSLARAFFDFAIERPDHLDLVMGYEARHFDYLSHRGPDRTIGEHRTACQQVSQATMGLVTTAIADGMAQKTICTPLTPRQLMLILWGQIFGFMQVLRMREAHFEAVFGTDRLQLFEQFVGIIEAGLAQPAPPQPNRRAGDP